MIKKRIVIGALAAALLLSGCAAHVRKADRTVRLTVEETQFGAQFALAEPTLLTLSDQWGENLYCADLLVEPGCLFEYNTYSEEYSYIYMGCQDEALPVDFRLDVALLLWQPDERVVLCEGSRGVLCQNDDQSGYLYQALLGEKHGLSVHLQVEAKPCDLEQGLWYDAPLPEMTDAQLKTLTDRLDALAGAVTLREGVPTYQVQVGDVVYDPAGVGYRLDRLDSWTALFEKKDDSDDTLSLCPCAATQLSWLIEANSKPTTNSNGVELYHHAGDEYHYYTYRGEQSVYLCGENRQAYKMFFPAE